jgi:hypothetical protein
MSDVTEASDSPAHPSLPLAYHAKGEEDASTSTPSQTQEQEVAELVHFESSCSISTGEGSNSGCSKVSSEPGEGAMHEETKAEGDDPSLTLDEPPSVEMDDPHACARVSPTSDTGAILNKEPSPVAAAEAGFFAPVSPESFYATTTMANKGKRKAALSPPASRVTGPEEADAPAEDADIEGAANSSDTTGRFDDSK